MEEALKELLKASPYLAFLVFYTLRQDKRIDTLLESQRWLIEQLMALHPPQDEKTTETHS